MSGPPLTASELVASIDEELRKVDRFAWRLREALLAAYQQVADDLPWEAVHAAALQQDWGRVMTTAMVFWEGFRPQLERAVTNSLLPIVTAAGVEEVRRFGGVFDLTNPEAVRWARERGAKLVTAVTDAQRDAIRVLVARAEMGEMTPAGVARALRSVVGLDGPRAKALAAFEARTFAAYPGPLRPSIRARLEARVARYGERLRAARTRTIARTEAMFAANAGKLAAWEDAAQQGHIPPHARKRWVVTKDDRLCPRCRPLHNVQAKRWEAFPGTAVTAPPLHPNCRCVMTLVPAGPKVLPRPKPLPPIPPDPPEVVKIASLPGTPSPVGAPQKWVAVTEVFAQQTGGMATAADIAAAMQGYGDYWIHELGDPTGWVVLSTKLKQMAERSGLWAVQREVGVDEIYGVIRAQTAPDRLGVPTKHVQRWLSWQTEAATIVKFQNRLLVVQQEGTDAVLRAWATGKAVQAEVFDLDAMLAWKPPVPVSAQTLADGTAAIDDLLAKRLAAAKGTNPGGLYEATDGSRWYVKFYDDPAQGWGEHVANRVYRALGVDVPESVVGTTRDGRHVFASRWIESAAGTVETLGLTPERATRFMDGFVGDVLTANWDAVGAGMEHPLGNMLVLADGAVLRVDQGGALLFRGLTGRKPRAVLREITEWEKFLDGTTNPLYAQVARAAHITTAEDLGARLVKQLDAVLDNAVRHHGGSPVAGWRGLVEDALRAVPSSAAKRTAVDEMVAMLEARTAKLAAKRAALGGDALLPPLPPIDRQMAEALVQQGLRVVRSGTGRPVAPFASAEGPSQALLRATAQAQGQIMEVALADVRVSASLRRVDPVRVAAALAGGERDITLYRFKGKLFAATADDVARVSAYRLRVQAGLAGERLPARVIDLEVPMAAAPTAGPSLTTTQAWDEALAFARTHPEGAGTLPYDGGDIEDLAVKVRRVVDARTGDVYTEVKFKVTTDAGRRLRARIPWDRDFGSEMHIPDAESAAYRVLYKKEPPHFGDRTAVFFDRSTFGSDFDGRTQLHVRPDGTRIYFHTTARMDSQSVGYSWHNLVQVFVKGDPTPAELDALMQSLGLPAAVPTPAQTRALAENRILRLFHPQPMTLTPAERARILAEAKREGWNAAEVRWERDTEGYLQLVLPEQAGQALAKRANVEYFEHAIGTHTVERWVLLLAGDGLKATTVRFSEGLPVGGQSSYRDVTTGGGDYVFTRPVSSRRVTGDIVWRADRLLRRLDWTAHDVDAYGATNPFADWDIFGQKAKTQRSWRTLSAGRALEVMFKGRLSWGDVEYITVTRAVRNDVIRRLRALGILQIGGRSVEDVIREATF